MDGFVIAWRLGGGRRQLASVHSMMQPSVRCVQGARYRWRQREAGRGAWVLTSRGWSLREQSRDGVPATGARGENSDVAS
jgi:hypothetical protein